MRRKHNDNRVGLVFNAHQKNVGIEGKEKGLSKDEPVLSDEDAPLCMEGGDDAHGKTEHRVHREEEQEPLRCSRFRTELVFVENFKRNIFLVVC